MKLLMTDPEIAAGLTDAEWAVKEWHDSCLASGFLPHEATAAILAAVPLDGTIAKLLADPLFSTYLNSIYHPKPDRIRLLTNAAEIAEAANA